MNDTPIKAVSLTSNLADSPADSLTSSVFSDVLESCVDEYTKLHDTGVAAIAKVIQQARNLPRWNDKLLALAFRDDLTGLCNRRGFRILAQQHLKLARAKQRRLLLFFADLDGLKQINDRFGHREGDRALVRAAASFKKIFRGSDVTARIGGDEFIALIVEGPRRKATSIRRHLKANLASRASDHPGYVVSLSIGVASLDPHAVCSLDELLERADQALYEQRYQERIVAYAEPVAGDASRFSPLFHEVAANSSAYEANTAPQPWSGDSLQSGDGLCSEASR